MAQEKVVCSFRKINVFDAPVFAPWRKDAKLGRQVGWAIDPKKWNINDEKTWIKKVTSDKRSEFWAASVGGKIIGRVGLYNIDFAKSEGEVSLLIGSESGRNLGLGKQMLKFVLDQGENALALKRIYATIFEDNSDAVRFFELNGFKKSGSTGEMNFLGEKRTYYYFDYLKE